MGNRALRWGVLGTGRSARRFAEEAGSLGIPVAAAASRDAGKARAFATEAGAPRYHGSYQALLSDSGVDAVFVALPASLRAEWAGRAAEAGKHVICPGPAALDAVACSRLVGAARRARVFLMEGHSHRCHPVWDLVRALLGDAGPAGSLRRIECRLRLGLPPDSADPRQRRDLGGGALNEAGSLCLSLCLLLAGESPDVLEASAVPGPEGGADESVTARLRFAAGVEARIDCSLRGPAEEYVVLHGDCGSLEIPSPWNPHPDRAAVRILADGAPEEAYHAGDGLPALGRMAALAQECVDIRECPAMPWKDSLALARALEALRRAAGHDLP
jgi:predicted dehydrogenase